MRGLLFLLLFTPALAQDFVAQREALKQQDDKLWAAMPLRVKKVLFVEDEPQGYGLYTPRETINFPPQTPLNVYVELEGFAYTKVKEFYKLDLTLDFTLNTKAGQEVLRQENFNTIATVSRNPSKEFYAHVAFTFTGLAANDYSVTLQFRDKISGKTALQLLEFKINP